MVYKNIIYIDKLTFNSAFLILKKYKKYKIYILDDLKSRISKFLFYILNKLKYNVNVLDFFAGHITNQDNETITMVSVKLASNASVDYVRENHSSILFSKFLPKEYNMKALNLFLAKLIYPDLYYIFLRSELVRSLRKNRKHKLILEKSNLIDLSFLKSNENLISIDFYKPLNFFSLYAINKYLFFFLKETIKMIHYKFTNLKSIKINNTLPGVLTFQSNTLRSDLSLRGDPNWVDRKNISPNYNTFVFSNTKKYFGSNHIHYISDDFKKLKDNNVFSVEMNAVSNIPNLYYLFKFLKKCYRYRNIITFHEKFILFEFLSLIHYSINFEKFIKKYKIRVIYFNESNSNLIEAISLITLKNNLKTIAYQYSNLPFFVTLMSCHVDKYLLSSDIYKKCFKRNKIGPISFKSIGYKYGYSQKYLIEKSKNRRKHLANLGVNFIICYFDERVDYKNKWGTVSNKEHLSGLKVLINYILDNKNIGLIIKSQFTRYSPSVWYKNENLFKTALNSNRYIELNEGYEINRNDILPTEAALSSDLCISQKFGATAAVESAILRKRTVLIDKYPIKTEFDNLYSKSQITFKSISEIIIAINEFLSGNIKYSNLGDWSTIINKFSKHNDQNNLKRLRNEIEEML